MRGAIQPHSLPKVFFGTIITGPCRSNVAVWRGTTLPLPAIFELSRQKNRLTRRRSPRRPCRQPGPGYTSPRLQRMLQRLSSWAGRRPDGLKRRCKITTPVRLLLNGGRLEFLDGAFAHRMPCGFGVSEVVRMLCWFAGACHCVSRPARVCPLWSGARNCRAVRTAAPY